MILPWRWREVYCSFSLHERERIFDALESAGISYDYRIDGSADPSLRTQSFSGLRSHHAAEFRVFVRPKDYEEAAFIVRKALENSDREE